MILIRHQRFLTRSNMKLKTFFIAGAALAVVSVTASAKGTQSSAQQIEDLRRKFFMPVATNSLCPEKYRVSAEKFAAFRTSALTYLDYLHASAEQSDNPQFEKVRAEITGTDIPPSFLSESTKIYRSYPPAEAQSLFCTRLNRMVDTNIDIMGMLMREGQKHRGEPRAD